MSANPLSHLLTVDLFEYPYTMSVLGKSEDQLKSDAKQIIDNIINHRVCSIFRTFSINLATLEICNSRFSEKQVSRIDDNFYYYSFGRRLPINRSSSRAPKGASCLVKKTFSGDVSGEIGESLFTYFLLTEMGVDPSEISHLRPGKKATFLVPDFLVYDNSHKLSALVGRNNYRIPILVEVKGFTGMLEPNRLSHALEQLQSLIGRSYIGFVFLAARNQRRRRYDTYMMRVEN
jgi:hypothetical protein